MKENTFFHAKDLFIVIWFSVTHLTFAQDFPNNNLGSNIKFENGNYYYKPYNKPVFSLLTLKVEDSPEFKKLVVVPAEFKEVTEIIEVSPASAEWVVKDSTWQREVIPAEFRTLTKQIKVRDAYIDTLTISAIYKSVKKQVLVNPGGFKEWVEVDYETQQRLVEIDRKRFSLDEKISAKLEEINGLISDENLHILPHPEDISTFLTTKLDDDLIERKRIHLEYLVVKSQTLESESDTLLEERCNKGVHYLNRDSSIITPKKLKNIPNKFGSTEVRFLKTSSDNKYADNPVIPLVTLGLRNGLQKANQVLKNNKHTTLKTISISCTINGCHGSKSNHFRHQAIDIALVNGLSVRNYWISDKLRQGSNFEILLNDGVLENGDEKLNGLADTIDDFYNTMNDERYIRETYYPAQIKKYFKESGKWKGKGVLKDHDKIFKSHQGHMHFSFR